MSAERRLVHVTYLHPTPAYYRPKDRCLTIGDPKAPERALADAKEAAALLPYCRSFLFIEGEDMPATRKLTCKRCDARQTTRFNLVP